MRRVLRAGALGRPRGLGWGGRWERGSGWGTHVNPWLIHVNVWQKPLQYCKVISLQLIKINEKQNNNTKKKLKNKLTEGNTHTHTQKKNNRRTAGSDGTRTRYRERLSPSSHQKILDHCFHSMEKHSR